MDLKNNVDEQRSYLKNNLENINVVVSAILGTKINLKIEEGTDYKKNTYFSLLDSKNRKAECGIMKAAFKNVYIESSGMWWGEKGVIIDLNFRYDHIDMGHNSATLCTIKVEDNFVSVLNN